MPDFRFYLDAADELAEQAGESPAPEGASSRTRAAVASILFASAALESFVNGLLEDYAAVPGSTFERHERAFMLEQDILFQDSGPDAGLLTVSGSRYRPLEHKVLFLLRRVGKHKVDKGSKLWQRFRRAKDTRDALVHPRRSRETTPLPTDAEEAVAVTRELISTLGRLVLRKPIRGV
jgi:hypothetical protein